MKKPPAHQIDDAARVIFDDLRPKTWVANEHRHDYGKDYLVEMGDDNGDLTGESFYVQLKGQVHVRFNSSGKLAKFSLKTKHAIYYLDKVKELPVFLVVVDVTQKKGWWVHLQPILAQDSSWRRRNSVVIDLPTDNNLADAAKLRAAVETGKKWMRKRHPLAIPEAIRGERDRLTSLDPRFELGLTLKGDTQVWHLNPKEPVEISVHIEGQAEEIQQKLADLLEKGQFVDFSPGELTFTGSPLFEAKNDQGRALQISDDGPGELTLTCCNSDGQELGHLSQMPGTITGGIREKWYEGGLANSPLRIKVGPIAPGVQGSVNLTVRPENWDGQGLSTLAYFDRIFRFFSALPESASATVECLKAGNQILKTSVPMHELEFVGSFSRFVAWLNKARIVFARFGADVAWRTDALDDHTFNAIDDLYAIFFGGGLKYPIRVARHLEVDAEANFDELDRASGPVTWRIDTEEIYTVFGVELAVGRLVYEMSQMTASRDGPKVTLTPSSESEMTVKPADPTSAF